MFGNRKTQYSNVAKGCVMPSKPYTETLSVVLKTREDVINYLNDTADAADDEGAFLVALRHVATIYGGGMKQIAEESGLNRENLYTALSENGDPRLSSLLGILDTIGLKLAVSDKAA